MPEIIRNIQVLEFVDVSFYRNELNESLKLFKLNHQYENSSLEYDKQCFLDSNVFYSEVEKKDQKIIIRHPLYNNIIKESDKIKKIEVMNKKVEDKGFIDLDKLKINSPIIISVLKLIREKKNLDYDLFLPPDIINFFP